jgi:hypothetical protein
MGNEQDGDKRAGNEFDRKMHELRSGVTPRFLVKLTGGAWELLRQAPALGSGPYIERMPNRTIRQWNNRTVGDTSYIDL